MRKWGVKNLLIGHRGDIIFLSDSLMHDSCVWYLNHILEAKKGKEK